MAAATLRGLHIWSGLFFLLGPCTGSIDEYMSCDRYFENKRSARLLDDIPCDMSKVSYCQHKGKGYPEAQIWRFKEENRALMRRLYGDMESNSVYREMRASNMAKAATQESEEPSPPSAPADGPQSPLDHGIFSSLEYNIRLGSGLATVQSARKQVVGPAEAAKRRPPTKTKKKVLIKRKKLKKKPGQQQQQQQPEQQEAQRRHDFDGETASGAKTTTTTPTTSTMMTTTVSDTEIPIPLTTDSPPLAESSLLTTITTKGSDTTTLLTDDADESTETTSTVTTTTAEETVLNTTVTSAVQSTVETAEPELLPQTTDAVTLDYVDDGDGDETTTMAMTTVSQTTATTLSPPPPPPQLPSKPATFTLSNIFNNYVDSTDFRTPSPPEKPQDRESVAGLPEILASVDLESLEKYVGDMLPKQQQQQQQQQDSVPATDVSGEAQKLIGSPTSSDDADDLEYEEYEEEVEVEVDADEIEDQGEDDDSGREGFVDEELSYEGTSVNACPVKEEVFAPYWANNTRDQVLALLNLYPFEQYIHMETCKFPEEEMMCRKGCRCEQQYRLHRLLAFDPSNECRGIFSDWFRFPSYCICKCYDVAQTFLPKDKRRKPRVDKSLAEPPKFKADVVVEDGSSAIPAILPYEAKESILRDMKVEVERSKTSEATPTSTTTTISPPSTTTSAKDQENMVNVGGGSVEKRPAAASPEDPPSRSERHFFYSNPPVFEYHLTDGSKGVVSKTPR